MIGGSFTIWGKSPTKVRLLPSYRNWETWMLSFLITFQRMAPKFLKQMVLGYKRDKRPGKDLHLKWANREFATISFLK